MEVLVNYLEADNVHLHHCQHCQRRRCFQPINPCALALKMIGSCHKHGQPATSSRLKKSSPRLGSSLAILSSNQHVFQSWNSNHELRDRWRTRKLLQTLKKKQSLFSLPTSERRGCAEGTGVRCAAATKMTGAHTMSIDSYSNPLEKKKKKRGNLQFSAATLPSEITFSNKCKRTDLS